jgi:hypothetical protein
MVNFPLPHRGRGVASIASRVRVSATERPSPAFGLRPQAPSPAVRERENYVSPYRAAALSWVSFFRISGERCCIWRSMAAREFGQTLSGCG